MVLFSAGGGNEYGQSLSQPKLMNATAVACGSRHTLALRSDGTVLCWGDNSHGQSTPPEDLVDVQAVACGGYHSVALKSDGTVVCWGRNNKGQCNSPDGEVFEHIAAGQLHTVGITTGDVLLDWGDNSFDQQIPPELIFVEPSHVSCGAYHTMVLSAYDGACCVESQCHVISQPSCVNQGGQWHGAGSSCMECDLSASACCVSTGCSITSSEICLELGGNWLIEGGTCDDCPSICIADVNGDLVVDIQDLLSVIAAWGSCP